MKERRTAKWRKPIPDVLKINSDGAFHCSTKQGGWGYVIWDHNGVVVQAGAGGANHLMDAFHSEVLACAAAVGAASERGMMKIELETDSMLLKSALQENSFNLSAMGGVILEIKNVISSSFISFSVHYCLRECNKVAHELAKLGCNLLDPCSWAGTPPGLERLVTSDLAGPPQ
ncbi:hypothetical protein OsJ_06893 [Oryza sativa Japonica Group]|uniref:RNase H type-1 domain-containing protein n=1 Tax=Oryza sativa subsp. japonica TaxID=39947 RepID=B9F078_ORYSJ|nr:hypothetical protein OsJ_06893 [Oryza sativa Japonica Group]